MKKKREFKIQKGRGKRPRIVWILSVLLVLQAGGLFMLGVYHFSMSSGPQLFYELFGRWLGGGNILALQPVRFFFHQLMVNSATTILVIALVESAALFALTVLALWAAVGVFRMWRIGWTQAMLVQGASLLTALILYFINRPRHIFILMATGVFMVLYLNYADLRYYFQTADDEEEE